MKKIISSLIAISILSLALAGCMPGVKGSNKMPDTVKWFNAAHAVLIEVNQGNHSQYSGYIQNDATKEIQIRSLDEYWGVTDRKSADENIKWLIDEGHRTVFKEDIAALKDNGFLDISADELKKELTAMAVNGNLDEDYVPYYLHVKNVYDKNGENAINAWDYSRIFQLYATYYIAGYYTREESLDKSLEFAKTIQSEYTNWDEFFESYFDGYMYWSEEFEATEGTQTAKRKAIYEDLKKRSDSPYSVEWNATLEKSW